MGRAHLGQYTLRHSIYPLALAQQDFLRLVHLFSCICVPATWNTHGLHKIPGLIYISNWQHSSTKAGNFGLGLGSLLMRHICPWANSGAGSKKSPYRLSLLPFANSSFLKTAWRGWCAFSTDFSCMGLRTQMPHMKSKPSFGSLWTDNSIRQKHSSLVWRAWGIAPYVCMLRAENWVNGGESQFSRSFY